VAAFVPVLVLELVCCAGGFANQENDDSDAGDPTALPERLDSSAAPTKEAGGEVPKPVEPCVNPKALNAEKRPLLDKAPPKLVRRGGCESKALVTGCGVASALLWLLLLLLLLLLRKLIEIGLHHRLRCLLLLLLLLCLRWRLRRCECIGICLLLIQWRLSVR